MKAYSRSIALVGLLVITLFVAALPASAQNVSFDSGGISGDVRGRPSQLPIQSSTVLKAFALSQVVSAELTVYGSTLLPRGSYSEKIAVPYTGSPDSKLVSGVDVQSLLNKVSAFTAVLQVTKLTDPLSVNITLRNRDGYILFHGSQVMHLIQEASGAYTFNAKVALTLFDFIPLPYPNATGAWVVVRNNSGFVIANRSLPVQNGYILYQKAAADRPGELIVTSGDPTNPLSTVFNLNTGLQQGVDSYQSSLGGFIEEVYQFADPSDIGAFIKNPREAVIVVEFTTDAKDVLLVPDKKWAVRPIGMLARDISWQPSYPWWGFTTVSPNGDVRGSLPKGKYIMVYIFPGDNLDNVPIVFLDGDRKG